MPPIFATSFLIRTQGATPIDFLDYARSQEPECAFAVEYGDEAVGGVGFLLGRDIARISAEMGYWLSEEFWGRGIATRAVTAMSDWAFDNYHLTRVFAMAFVHNAGSIRVLEKVGLRAGGAAAAQRHQERRHPRPGAVR